MSAIVHTLFPTPVFETELTASEVDDDFEIILKKTKNKNAFKENLCGNLISCDSFVLDEWNLKSLKESILNQLNLFSKKVLRYNYEEVYITQSWVNVNKYNDFHSVHNHKNSLLSGVVYINASPKCGEIVLYKNDREIFPDINFDPENCLTWSTRYFTPKKYQLILFPSNILHSVNKNLDKNVDRISLSFNTSLNRFGSIENKTYLKQS